MSVQIPSSRSVNESAGGSMIDMMVKPRNQFEEFCEETTLNGWYYLAKKGVGKLGRGYWIGVVLCSLFLSGNFIFSATNEYLDASVIITVDSVTASLDKVIFPSLVICNQNQVIRLGQITCVSYYHTTPTNGAGGRKSRLCYASNFNHSTHSNHFNHFNHFNLFNHFN